MGTNGIHELAAAYALHALDPHQETEFEGHLRYCSRCREELSSLQEVAATLAFGADPAPPRAGLRSRILVQVADERASERETSATRRWWSWRLTAPLAGAAALAACLAVALGLWANSLSSSLDEERSARKRQEQTLAVLGDPAARTSQLVGANGRLVVSSNGSGALVLAGLRAAPEGKTYKIWVMEGADAPRPAGLFDGAPGKRVVGLTRPVPRGAQVAVTIERDGGVDAPTAPPLFKAQT